MNKIKIEDKAMVEMAHNSKVINKIFEKNKKVKTQK